MSFYIKSGEILSPSQTSNTVQQQSEWKPVFFLRVKMVVRGVDNICSSISEFENEYWCTYTPLGASMHVTIRLKLLHANTVFNIYMTHTFNVKLKQIAMLSITNISLLRMLE